MTTETIDTPEAMYRAFAALKVEGGWHRRSPALWPAPRRNFLPFRWRWQDVKPVLDAAGRFVSTEFAERRNLTLTNPAPGNEYATVRTIVAAYQMMLPGETARCHRHSPNALRLVLEGRGTYTIVDGERLEMEPGDVLLTPNWSWHAHGTEGTDACYWLDYLDVPLVQLLEPMFFERHPQEHETEIHTPASSPMVFPFRETVARLHAAGPDAQRTADREVELGAPALQTIDLHVQQLDRGTITPTVRTTANQIYTVISGSGRTTVDGESLDWHRGDTIAVPAWQPYSHHVDEDSMLFKVTDRPVMQKLRFLWTGLPDGGYHRDC